MKEHLQARPTSKQVHNQWLSHVCMCGTGITNEGAGKGGTRWCQWPWRTPRTSLTYSRLVSFVVLSKRHQANGDGLQTGPDGWAELERAGRESGSEPFMNLQTKNTTLMTTTLISQNPLQWILIILPWINEFPFYVVMNLLV